MRTTVFCLLVLAASNVLAQDYNVSVRPNSTGFETMDMAFPKDVKVYDLNRQAHILKPEGLTLIQIWGTCCGGEPEVYSRVENLFETYGDQGLSWISINFENGLDYAGAVSEMTKYFATKEKPANLYTDPLGYSIDLLNVSGFPTYFLVDKDGRVVFRTNGKDDEGMARLEGEIQARIN